MRFGLKDKSEEGAEHSEHEVEMTEQEKQFEEAKEKASKIILNVEQFRATVNKSKGKDDQNVSDNGLSDKNFFHVTCHIDPQLKNRIEKGEFIELDKLLPKTQSQSSEGKMELVSRNGSTFFVPSEGNTNKINGIRQWEQAFRVYAAIYSAANPGRAAEIWQYVYVINTAATSYTWENVSTYDYTFRQLMAFNPGRNWSKSTHKGGIYV